MDGSFKGRMDLVISSYLTARWRILETRRPDQRPDSIKEDSGRGLRGPDRGALQGHGEVHVRVRPPSASSCQVTFVYFVIRCLCQSRNLVTGPLSWHWDCGTLASQTTKRKAQVKPNCKAAVTVSLALSLDPVTRGIPSSYDPWIKGLELDKQGKGLDGHTPAQHRCGKKTWTSHLHYMTVD